MHADGIVSQDFVPFLPFKIFIIMTWSYPSIQLTERKVTFGSNLLG